MSVIAPFPYYGGKMRMLDFIHNHLPKGELFIDLFGGSGVVSLSVFGIFNRIIYNDIDDRVVNFFRVLRDQKNDLIHKLELTPVSRVEFQLCEQRSDDPVEDARRLFVRILQSFSNAGAWVNNGWQSPSNKRTSCLVKQFKTKLGMLDEISRRFSHILIENRDWRKIIDYARHDTLIFADPPYDLNSRSGRVYGFEMEEKDHRDLAELLKKSDANAMVCGYHSPLYDEIYSDWVCHEHRIQCRQSAGQTNGRSDSVRVECLWVKKTTHKNGSLLYNTMSFV